MVIALNRKKEENGLRPLRPSQDLNGVATLIEEAFALELDQAGRAALREMHRIGQWGFLLGWLDYFTPDVKTYLNGFVWLENGRIVGNITVSRNSPGAKHWFISNVAVAKEYRRRGIARALMTAAVEFVKEMRGYDISLQVRQGNLSAVSLYESLGFQHVSATTYLRLLNPKETFPQLLPSNLSLREHKLDMRDAVSAYSLARLATPASVQREKPLRQSQFRHSKTETQFKNFWRHLVGLGKQKYWVVEQPNKTFVATLDIIPGSWRNDHKLSLLIHPDWQGILEERLLSRALNYLQSYPPYAVSIQHSEEHQTGIQACRTLGFSIQRTHIWMKLLL